MSTPPLTNDCRFETTDAFGWSGFARKLESFLLTEAEFVDGGLVASLNAPFGSGKTTFLRMWKEDLDSRRQSDANVPMCILLNAWEDDYCGDPLLSLVDALEKEMHIHSTDAQTENRLDSLKEATRDLGWFMAGMVNSAVTHWTGLDPVKAGEFTENKKSKRGSNFSKPDILAQFHSRKEALHRLKAALRSLFQDHKNPVFVLVDELDRCRPDFAIHYLETIKHVYDVEGLAFVLAVDLLQLENSARALFGTGLNFPEYYRKFAHRNLQLPSPDEVGVQKLVSRYIDRYLHTPEPEALGRKSLLNLHNTSNALMGLPRDFRLTPRQIQEAFRIIGHLTSVTEKKSGDLFYHIANAAIFLSFLSIGNPTLFKEFEDQHLSIERLLEIISHLSLSNHRDWWAFVLSMNLSTNGSSRKIEDVHAAFQKYGFVAKDTNVEEFRQQIANYSSGGYRGYTSLFTMAKKIQELESFGI